VPGQKVNLRLQIEIALRWPNPSSENAKGVDRSLSISSYRICTEKGGLLEEFFCQAAASGTG